MFFSSYALINGVTPLWSGVLGFRAGIEHCLNEIPVFRFHHPKERRDAVVVRRVRVGAAFEQRQDDAWIVDRTLGSVPVPSVATVPTGRRYQRPVAVAVPDVRIGTRREQETHDFDRPVVGRLHQRRGPFAVLQIRIGPRVEQQPIISSRTSA